MALLTKSCVSFSDYYRARNAQPVPAAELESLFGVPSDPPKHSGPKRKSQNKWSLWAPDEEPGNLDKQITSILMRLPADQEIWEVSKARYTMRMFCGLFMDNFNEGQSLHPETLKMLGERGILLDLDIYGPD